MSRERPRKPASAKPNRQLKDLPAQPVDEKEAEGVRGGLSLHAGGGFDVPPGPCSQNEISSMRQGSTR